MPHIHVLHENAEWTAPLLRALERIGAPYRDWHLDNGRLDLADAPPAGIFYNRMSASSHTRGHRYAPEFTGCVLDWLDSHGARVLNPRPALRLEISKVAQYAALRSHGIAVPKTIAASGSEALVVAARSMTGPFITKHNRAGKGLGVRLFEDAESLRVLLADGGYAPSVDGVTLVQEYIKAPSPHIIRAEFIGRKFVYAVRVDTSEGFELCPAQDCGPEDAFCRVGSGAGAKFEIVKGFSHPLVRAYERFMQTEQLDVAAFEFIVDERGRAYTYDINTNTNYNPDAEARAGVSAMGTLAEYLNEALDRYRRASESHAA